METLTSIISLLALMLKNESYTPQTQNGLYRRYYPYLLDSQRLDFLTRPQAAYRRYDSGRRPHLVALNLMRNWSSKKARKPTSAVPRLGFSVAVERILGNIALLCCLCDVPWCGGLSCQEANPPGCEEHDKPVGHLKTDVPKRQWGPWTYVIYIPLLWI